MLKFFLILFLSYFFIISCESEPGVNNDPDLEAPTWNSNKTIAFLSVESRSLMVTWNGARDNIGVSNYYIYQDGTLIDKVSSQALMVENLSPDTEYEFRVEAEDKQGNISIDGPIGTVKTLEDGSSDDTESPIWDNNDEVRVIEVGTSGVVIEWDEATDNIGVVGYKIFKNGEFLKDVTNRDQTIYSLYPDSDYLIKIEAFDEAGNVSTDGPEVTFRTSGDIVTEIDINEIGDSTSTDLFESSQFLYRGLNPVQIGVDETIFDRDRIAILRGKVLDSSKNPISGVKISLLNSSEYGYTFSRTNGEFDLVVNGGSTFTIKYEKDGYIPVQRNLSTKWKDYFIAEDVIMINYDSEINEIAVNVDHIQVARGSVSEDSDGVREATLLIPPQTGGVMVLNDGTEVELNSMTIRATEFTVGEDGLKRMPGKLPPTSGYTYAVELSLDEAIDNNAKEVKFNKTLYFYLDNFLDFPVGTVIPVGYYDRDKGVWIPSKNGKLIKILSIENGLAIIDYDGDGEEESVEILEQYGFTDEELEQLAILYSEGKTLWRVPIDHFTPFDCNWPINCDGCSYPDIDMEEEECEPCTASGSIIYVQERALGELLPVFDTGFTLNYKSTRMSGFKQGYRITIPLIGYTYPSELKKVFVETNVAGKQEIKEFNPESNLTYIYEWDGLDAYGRKVEGEFPGTIRVGYSYNSTYESVDEGENGFSNYGDGENIGESRINDISWVNVEIINGFGTFNILPFSFGGWTLSNHHRFDALNSKIYYGSGNVSTGKLVNKRYIKLYHPLSTGDIVDDSLTNIRSEGSGLTIRSDDSVYFLLSDGDDKLVRKTDKDGNTTTIAGVIGEAEYSGDGGLAKDAHFLNPLKIRSDKQDNLYVLESDGESEIIRKIDKNGYINRVLGNFNGEVMDGQEIDKPGRIAIDKNNGKYYFANTDKKLIQYFNLSGNSGNLAGTGNDSIEEQNNINGKMLDLSNPVAVMKRDDGIYFASDGIVYKIDSLNIATIVAGSYDGGSDEDGIDAKNADLGEISCLENGENGFYICDIGKNKVRYVNDSGIITTIAGSGEYGYDGDGGDGKDAKLRKPYDVALSNDGYLYITDTNNSIIRRVNITTNVITTYAGVLDNDGELHILDAYCGDGSPKRFWGFSKPKGIDIDSEGNIYIADSGNSVIRKIDINENLSTFVGSKFGEFITEMDGYEVTFATGYIDYNNNGELDLDNNEIPSLFDLKFDGENLFYTDQNSSNDSVYKVDPDGNISKINFNIAFDGESNGVDIKTNIDDFVLTNSGEILYTDSDNNKIMKMTPNGKVKKVAGTGIYGYTEDNERIRNNHISKPSSIVVDNNGNIYFLEDGYEGGYNFNVVNKIRKIDSFGVITTYVGNGETGYINDGELAIDSPLNVVSGMALDSNNRLHFYDNGDNERIFRVEDDGRLNTIAGGCFMPTETIYENRDGLKRYPICKDNSRNSGKDYNSHMVDFYSLYPPSSMEFSSNDVLYLKVGGGFGRITSNKYYDNEVGNNYIISSESGDLLYYFDLDGKHMKTVNRYTEKDLFSFEYDGDNLTSITDQYGNKVEITRDGDNITIQSPSGRNTYLELNSDGYLEKLKLNDDIYWEMGYYTDNKEGLLSSYKDPNGGISYYYYDETGRLIEDKNSEGDSQTLEEDDTGVRFSTPMGRVSNYGNSVPANNGSGDVPIESENSCENSDPTGATTTTVSNPSGQTTTKSNGMKLMTSKSDDPVTDNDSEYINEVIAEFPNGKRVKIEQDREVEENEDGEVIKIKSTTTINDNRSVVRVFDKESNILTVTSPMGKTGKQYFDQYGRVIKVEREGIYDINYEYDNKGRISKVYQGEGDDLRGINYYYNDMGYLDKTVDHTGREQSYEYDEVGRLINVISPDQSVVSTDYDDNGNITSVTPAHGYTHSYEYTSLDQVSSYISPEVDGVDTLTSYDYNPDGQLTELSYPEDIPVFYDYDPDSGRMNGMNWPGGSLNFVYDDETFQLLSVTNGSGESLSYSYDGGLLISEESSGTVSGLIEWDYDNDLRLSTLSIDGEDVIYQFNDDNGLIKAGDVSYIHNETTGFLEESILGEFKESYIYNNFGETTKYSVYEGDQLIFEERYSYDSYGKISQKVVIDGDLTETFDYVYNNIGKLVEVSIDGVVKYQYDYDDNGNILVETVDNVDIVSSYDHQDRLINRGDKEYIFTDRGSLLKVIKNGSETIFDYDVFGNLLEVLKPNGDQIEYIVDARNRRIGKKINGELKMGFLYGDQLNPIAKLDQNGEIDSYFIYGTRSNVPEYMIKDGKKYKFVVDHLGSVRKVIDLDTKEVVQEIKYTPYGEILSDTNPNFQPFGYVGGIYDQDTGLIRYGARDYDPETHRWTSKEPLGFAGSMNFYGYCEGDPVNFVDVNGLKTICYHNGIYRGILNEKDMSEIDKIAVKIIKEYYCKMGDKEFGQYLYYNNYHYYLGNLFRSKNAGRSIKNFPYPNPFAIAILHGHGRTKLTYCDGETFSNPNDLSYINNYQLPMYLVTPTGIIYKYVPNPYRHDWLQGDIFKILEECKCPR